LLLILLGTAVPILNLTGATKMVTDNDHALRIVQKMAKERSKTIGDVLAEFIKWEKNNEVKHFWPDENTACLMLIKRRASQ
jgi:hypothetical protein